MPSVRKGSKSSRFLEPKYIEMLIICHNKKWLSNEPGVLTKKDRRVIFLASFIFAMTNRLSSSFVYWSDYPREAC